MDFIGSVPKPIWDKALEISKKESFPVEQPETCPYIIIMHIADKQILALTGSFRRQHIDLFLTEVSPPGEITDPVTLDYVDKRKANKLVWMLISKALTSLFC